MIDLDKHRNSIAAFIGDTLRSFTEKNPSFQPNFLALFCYPVDGFLTVALCSRTEPENGKDFNVGDFGFPQTALYQPPEWYSEYWDRGEEALIRQSGVEYRPKANGGGDEAYCQPFGLFLSGMLRSHAESNLLPLSPKWLGVQVGYFYFDCWRHA